MIKRNIYISFGTAITVFLLVLGLGWLAIGTVLIFLLYVLFSSKLKPVAWIKKHIIISTVFTLTGVFLLAIAVRIFIIEIYTIPSGSMENTLLPGDKILVSKLSYGPKLPRSPFEIPWINFFFYLNKKARARSDSVWWNYKRLHGYSQIKGGDIVVFQFPKNEKITFIKRCTALPGDTLQIKDSEIFVNNRKQKRPETSKLIYRVWHNNIQEFIVLADSMDLAVYRNWYREHKDVIELNLSLVQIAKLIRHECIDSITPKIRMIDSSAHAFPWHNRFPWTIDQYGMFFIPEKGTKIILNEDNYLLYGKILDRYEHFNPVELDGKYFLKGTRVTEYTFKQDYCFMMGDNRHRSNDSRMWGLVPQEYIIGKAVVILFSNNYSGIKWNRCLKRI